MGILNSRVKLLVILLFFSVQSLTAVSSKSDLVKKHLNKSRKLTYKKPDSSLYHLGQAKFAAIGNTSDMIGVYFTYADYYTFGPRDLQRALQYLEKAEINSLRIQHIASIAEIQNRRGFVFQILGDIQKAIESYQKGIDIAKQGNDPKVLNNSYVKFASALIELELFDESLHYFSKAIDLANANPNVDKSFIYRSIARLYVKQSLYVDAERYLEEALAILDKQDESLKREHKHLLTTSLLAKVYHHTGRHEEALQIALVNKKWITDVKCKTKHAKLDLLLGKIYYMQQKDSLALTHALKSYHAKEKKNVSSGKQECVLLIATIYERMKNYKKACEFLRLHDEIRKKSPKNNLQKEFLIEKYFGELQQQEVQTQLATQEAQAKQMQLIVIIGISLGILLIAYILYTKRQAHWLQRIQKGIVAQKNMKSKLTKEQKKAAKIQQELNAILELQSEHNSSQPNAKIIQNTLQKLHNSTILTEEDWMMFKSHFQNMYPEFFKNFKTNVHSYSMGDLKLASLIRLNFNTKEIANMLAISPESVRKGKYRLRKKMSFNSEKELQQFIYSL